MSSITSARLIRGADGRLFAVSAEGVKEISEATVTAATSIRAGKGSQDHEAGRFAVTPGL